VVQILRASWLRILTGELGGCFALVAAPAALPLLLLGIASAAATIAAPWLPGRRLPRVVLIAATVPFAVVTWWTVVTPVIAILALVSGFAATRRAAAARLTARSA
jgi:hypothetical protein